MLSLDASSMSGLVDGQDDEAAQETSSSGRFGFSADDADVLVRVVKLAQKHGMAARLGTWKDYLLVSVRPMGRLACNGDSRFNGDPAVPVPTACRLWRSRRRSIRRSTPGRCLPPSWRAWRARSGRSCWIGASSGSGRLLMCAAQSGGALDMHAPVVLAVSWPCVNACQEDARKSEIVERRRKSML